MELRPAPRRREDAAPSARGAPRRRALAGARRRGRRPRARRSDRDPVARRARRQVDRRRVLSQRRRALRPARHGREYAVERLAEPGGLARAQRAHADYFAARPTAHGRSFGKRVEGVRQAAGARARQPVVGACVRPRCTRAGALAIRTAALGWYFTLAERVSGGASLRRARTRRGRRRTTPVEVRLEVAAFICFADGGARSRRGDRDRPNGRWRSSPTVCDRCSRASCRRCWRSHWRNPGRTRAGGARRRRRTPASRLRETIGASRSGLVSGADRRSGAGDVPTVAAMAARAEVMPPRSGSTRFQSRDAARGVGRRAAERRPRRRRTPTSRAFELAERAGLRDHASFALAGLGSVALAGGDLHDAEALARRALGRRRGGDGHLGRRTCARPARTRLVADGRSRRPRGCIGASSSGRSGSGRTKLARRSFSRSPAVRARRLSPVSPSSPTLRASTRSRTTSASALRVARSSTVRRSSACVSKPWRRKAGPRLDRQWQRGRRAWQRPGSAPRQAGRVNPIRDRRCPCQR